MKCFVVLSAILACAAAAPQVTIAKKGYGPTQFVRAPAHDSASIEHHRLGGNFAYSTAEAHAFASITPEISVATHPVAETTHVHTPAAVKTVQPAPIVHTQHAARPVFGEQPVFAQEPVVGPVAEYRQVHQQVYKQQHHTVHQPIAAVAQTHHVVAAPAVHAVEVAAPAVAVEGYAAGYAAAPAVHAFEGYAAAPALGYAHGAYAAAPALGYAAAPQHAILA